MRRGTRVGQAYVALTVDGSGINEEITNEIGDINFEEITKDAKKRAKDGWSAEELIATDNLAENVRTDMEHALKNIAHALEKDSAISGAIRQEVREGFNSGDFEHLFQQMQKHGGLNLSGEIERSFKEGVVNGINKGLQEAALRGGTFEMLSERGGITRPNENYQRVLRQGLEAFKATEAEYAALFDEAAKREAKREKDRLDAEALIQKARVAQHRATEAQMERDRKDYLARLRADIERRSALMAREQELMARVQEDDRWNKAVERAQERIRQVRFDSRVAESAIRNAELKLATLLADREALELKLDLDLPARELAMVEAKIRSIDATIELDYDSNALRRSLAGAGGSASHDFSSTIGKMFGKRSRNNFLNLIGSTIGGAAKMASLGTKAVQGFAQGFSEVSENASRFQKLLNGISQAGVNAGLTGGRAFAGIGASAAAAGPAIAVVILAMSAMVSVASALLAIVTALVATITSALVGALFVAGGAILALVTAGGLLTAAFTSMTEEQRKFLASSFTPVRDAFAGLGQIIFQEFTRPMENGRSAIEQWSRNIQNALALVGPLAKSVGRAFAEAGNIITGAFSGAGVQMFLATLTGPIQGLTNGMGTLEFIVNRLSVAFDGFFNGMLAMFSAALPYVAQFADYLARVGTNFTKWTTSPKGQNSIADFASRAVQSLQSLWGFVVAFTKGLSAVLFSPEAQSLGNTMFDYLADAFRRFKRAVADGSLQQWFADAASFGARAWGVLKAFGQMLSALNDSGVLKAVGFMFEYFAISLDAVAFFLGPVIKLFGLFGPAIAASVLSPLAIASTALMVFVGGVRELGNLLSHIPGLDFLNTGDVDWDGIFGNIGKVKNQFTDAFKAAPPVTLPDRKQYKPPSTSGGGSWLNSILNSGGSARDKTYQKDGGNLPDPPTKPEWRNPYAGWANSLIDEGPKISAQIKNAMISVNKQVSNAIRKAANAKTGDAARSALLDIASNIRDSADQTVNSARDALNSAAQRLASATTKGEAKRALAEVASAQRDLAAALANQRRINNVARRVNAQRLVDPANVKALVSGLKVQNATLADYAVAQERLAKRLDSAKQRLKDAIAMRDDFRKTITDSVKTYGALTTAQKQTVDGVEQALTYKDITQNLSDRLTKIKDFYTNLRVLLGLGLSNDAYKQIVDAGVEQGSEYAAALVAGGAGAVAQVNSLTSQIASAASSLGSAASSRMYQAGVDAARGLVEGLTSLSAQLDSAAARLGNSIARSIRRSLGIKSPSTVLIGMMEHVGDGAVIGLRNQQGKVDEAASRLFDNVKVSPEVAAYAAAVGGSPTVSGNGGQKFRDLIVNTPTENPQAVAMEVLSEVTGRL